MNAENNAENRPAYKGLTWDHPRGYVALERAAQLAQGLTLHWQRQPLEGFESHPIEELARQYDLIVLDHPHIGDAVHSNCLMPLEALFDQPTLQRWKNQSIGQTFESYRYQGRHWALPLDAAAQVAAARTDRIQGKAPETWDEVLAFARHQPIALSLAGPHALLTLFSLCTAHGEAPASIDPDTLFVGDALSRAWDLLGQLYALSYKGWLEHNPIAILEALARDPKAVYCPLVFGYVNYSSARNDRCAIQFLDVPTGRQLGSILGGTGLAVSRHTVVSEQLKEHLMHLLCLTTQTEFIPFADGQPSAREAWSDLRVNQACGGFFAQTARTLEAAAVRPRHRDYVPFQTTASQFVRSALLQRLPAIEVGQTLQALYQRFRPPGSEI